MPQTINCNTPVITVDVEDWAQSSWDRSLPITQRSANNTRLILRLLRDAGVRATMFILGKFAETFPEVVKEIQADGHEIASHGYGHVEIFKQTRKEFIADVRRSKGILEQIIGEKVRGYRAPDFSIISDTLWALEVLAETGFEYDSSIFPVRHSRYGIPNWPVVPVQVALPGGHSIKEFPIATFQCFGKNWPVGGGGYHRLLPGFLTRYLARSVMRSTPFVFYCHPYEFNALEMKEIRLKIPLSTRLHQGLGRGRFKGRFNAFLTQFGGQRVQDLLIHNIWPEHKLDQFIRPQ